MRILPVSEKRAAELERRARELRERMTESELKLWSALRRRRLGIGRGVGRAVPTC